MTFIIVTFGPLLQGRGGGGWAGHRGVMASGRLINSLIHSPPPSLRHPVSLVHGASGLLKSTALPGLLTDSGRAPWPTCKWLEPVMAPLGLRFHPLPPHLVKRG